QYFFLNGRFIRDKFLLHAVKEAYRGLTEPNKYPVLFLFLQMPPQSFDVNVHPTKIEVRFDNSNLIYSQVLGPIREKLLSIDLDVRATLPGGPAESSISQQETKQRITDAMAAFFSQNKSQGTTQRHFDFSTVAKKSDSQAVAMRQNFYDGSQLQSFSPQQEYLQIHDSYIITQTEDGFLIIDQHALHERIMYEDMCRKLAAENSGLQTQKLLIPETFEPSTAQSEVLENNKELLDRLGIEIEPFGPGIWAVQGFPALLNKVNPIDFMIDMLDILCDAVGKVDSERLLHKILDMAACKAAVKAGQRLSQAEISQLLADKETIERASRCPHGRPTIIKFGLADLEKQFKRT
ncbi:MAG: hypothetical protein PHP01_00085, partial [Phycisphaerae bacterium]|nr:hypothetical protein [Phycisphaerae bacterium]